MADTVVVTAASGPLGRRVVALIAADPAVARIVTVDRPGRPAPPAGSGAPIEHHAVELDDPEVKRLCEGAAAVVHLGAGSAATATGGADPGLDGTGARGGAGDVAATRALLACVGATGVPTVVVLSSAMVYGAWPGNPVPLTESAPLVPVPELPFAVERGEIERAVAALRHERSGAGTAPTLAVLRPAIAVGPDRDGWLGRSPWSKGWAAVDEAAPRTQYVHLDDVAAAVDLARRARLDGPFNVAPDGWLSPEARRRLQGGLLPDLPVPVPVAERVRALRWRLASRGLPAGVQAYTRYPWVVANDRLRAAGWVPAHTNEEAFVEAHPAGRLATLDARRRQQLSLGVLAAVALSGVAAVMGAAAVILRRRRPGRRPS
jgi:nucleoside-diphosphate-sugar epimerase